MSPPSTIKDMPLDGGVACLDFINSGYQSEKKVVVERLHSFDDLLMLTQRLSLLDNDTINELKNKADRHGLEAQQALSEVRQVRQGMFALFTALVQGQLEQLDPTVLEAFNDQLTRAQSNQGLSVKAGQLVRGWTNASVPLQLPLWAYVLSAQQLLLHPHHRYIKQCGGCEWLFLDETKNHRRKWCDMQGCGSSEKSKRYYQKKKQRAK